jgi:hypothetical protein
MLSRSFILGGETLVSVSDKLEASLFDFTIDLDATFPKRKPYTMLIKTTTRRTENVEKHFIFESMNLG